jgi:DNA polymerase-3 subunit gamma/tau
MAHQSLYRTYRPQTFADVVGQTHVTRTLRNAVAENQVAHAYLFTGPRGTGKTTTARILAKALLCEKGVTPEPDGTCEQCVDVAEGRHPDVFELDAASNTQVEKVREEIINRVQYAPMRGRFKLYIIDEVHMLSASSFNALLKTLEEPPPHVVFVLATTHPHKVPETIQSRCQRFDFRRISIEDLAERLRFIADAESIKVPDAALALIAKHAAGGMRDGITTLEQLAAFTGDNITLADVEGLLGEVDFEQLHEVAALVAARDIAGLFRWTARFAETGADMAEFVRSLTGHVRDLYVLAALDGDASAVDSASDNLARLQAQAGEVGTERLGRILELLGQLGGEMRWSSDPRLSIEVALTRMARPQGELTLEALDERLAAIETGRVAVQAPRPAADRAAAERPGKRVAKTAPAAAETAPATETDTPTPAAPAAPCPEEPSAATMDRAAIKRAWPGVVAEIRKQVPSRAAMYSVAEVDADADGETLVIEFPADQAFQLRMAENEESRTLLRSALTAVFGTPPPFRFQLGRGAVRPAAEATKPTPPAKPVAEPDPDPAGDPAADDFGDAYESDPYDVPPGAGEPDEPPMPEPEAPEGVSEDLAAALKLLGGEVIAEHPHDPTNDVEDPQ